MDRALKLADDANKSFVHKEDFVSRIGVSHSLNKGCIGPINIEKTWRVGKQRRVSRIEIPYNEYSEISEDELRGVFIALIYMRKR